MKKLLITFLFVVFCCSQLAYSGEKIVGNTPSGDPELDRSLEELSRGAKENVGEFARKLSRRYGIPQQTLGSSRRATLEPRHLLEPLPLLHPRIPLESNQMKHNYISSLIQQKAE